MSEVNSVLPTIRYTSQVPDSAKAGGRSAGSNVYQQFMMEMPAPTTVRQGTGKSAVEVPQIAWFFVPAEVSETITDPAERDKAARANASKLVNRFTSLSRRIRKNHGETHDFTFRKARDPDAGENGAWGLVVYRIEPGSIKPGPQRRAQVQAAA